MIIKHTKCTALNGFLCLIFISTEIAEPEEIKKAVVILFFSVYNVKIMLYSCTQEHVII